MAFLLWPVTELWTAEYWPVDASKILLHLLIGNMSKEIDVFQLNQEFSFVTKRNLQSVGATDCLKGKKYS